MPVDLFTAYIHDYIAPYVNIVNVRRGWNVQMDQTGDLPFTK